MIKQVVSTALLLLLTLTISTAQFTSIENSEAFLEKSASLTQTTNSLKCEFIQEKHLSFMSAPITSSGIFQYKEGNRIRWQYTEPYNYLIILNNGQLLIDDEGNQNEVDLSSNKMFDQINEIISNAMTGNVFGRSDQFEQSLSESDTEYKVNMLPINNEIKTYLSEIEIYLSKKTLLVSKVILKESLEDYTSIKFYNNKINYPVTDEAFTLNQ